VDNIAVDDRENVQEAEKLTTGFAIVGKLSEAA